MTEITELAQNPTRYGTNSQGVFTNQTDGAYVSYLDFMALVEALEKAQQTEKTLESRNRRLDGIITAAEKRIAELESRTVTVKLKRFGFIIVSGERVDVYMKADVDAALAAAGIKVEDE
ncbi:TPA: hypothetical protein PU265_001131 [Klebsiella pneumoniae]|nr:hypothetical protein [Klebsiella pneumoniae]